MPRKKSAEENPQWDEERRRKQSELAKKLVAEKKFGGSENGRKGGYAKAEIEQQKQLRLYELVDEALAEEAAQIVEAYLANLDAESPLYLRLEAAKSAFNISKVRKELELKERQDARENMNTAMLMARVKEKLERAGWDIDGEIVEDSGGDEPRRAIGS